MAAPSTDTANHSSDVKSIRKRRPLVRPRAGVTWNCVNGSSSGKPDVGPAADMEKREQAGDERERRDAAINAG